MKKTLVSLATVTALSGITAQGVSANAYGSGENTQQADTYDNTWSYTYEGPSYEAADYVDYTVSNTDYTVSEESFTYDDTASYDYNTEEATETVESNDVEVPQAPAPTADADVSTNNSGAASTAHSVASGKSYVYGANSATAVDCSALTQQFMKEHKGIDIPRTAAGQQAAGTQVSDPQPGDLVFFNDGTHVGIYIGNGQMVDALNPSEHVGERSVNYVSGSIDGYYRY